MSVIRLEKITHKPDMKLFFTTLTFAFFIILPAFGQAQEKKSYKATYITTEPSIDGVLNDSVWTRGTWIDDFTQYEPYNNKPATQRTEFKILFDDNNLFVAIRALDSSPDSIVNRMTRRDEADGDLVAIIIDSYHDLRTAFCFGVSSAGVKYDQLFTNDGQGQSDGTWDPNWWVRTSINKEGWIAEMKIPFSQVRFDKNSGDVWGLEMARIIYRRNETDFWQHIPKDAPGLVHLFGEMTGLEKIKPRKILDVTPYGVAKAETFKKDPSNPFLSSGRKYTLNGGIDAKIGVTNNMTMDLTINPDFGQVEADPSVINLSAFETFYKEKRPFFIEGNNITNFNLGVGDGSVGNDNIFYSRRIGRRPQTDPDLKDGWSADPPAFTNILGAAKLTGKTKDGLSVGFIEAVTAEMSARIDTEGGRINQTVEPLTNYLVGRVQKDINQGNTLIGGIFTSTNRDLDPRLAAILHNGAYTGGIDFTQYFKKKAWMVSLSAAFSDVTGSKEAITSTQLSSARYYQRPGISYVRLDSSRTSLAGSGGKLSVMKLNGHLNIMGVVTWKSPGFELNDIGYLRQADQILSVLWFGYNEWRPKGIYNRYNVNFDVFNMNNFGGNWLTTGFETNLSMTFKNLWNAWVYGNATLPQLSTSLLRGGPIMKYPGNSNFNLGLNTDFRKKFVLNLNAGTSFGYNKSNANYFANVSLDIKPAKYLLISLSPNVSYSTDQLQYVTTLEFSDNSGPVTINQNRYIFATIDQKTIGASIRVNVNLTPDLTLQYWGQPFIASGRYYNYKYITNPMADKFTDRFHTYTTAEISDNGNEYDVYDTHGANPDYQIGYNNFNYKAFLSNLVIRWEYNPGSTVFLVWSQTRSGSDGTGRMDYFNNINYLFSYKPTNIFLVKFSYRFGLK